MGWSTVSEHLQNCSSGGVFLVCRRQNLSKVVSGNQQQGVGQPRLTDAREEQRSNAAVAQITKQVNAGSDRWSVRHSASLFCCIWS